MKSMIAMMPAQNQTRMCADFLDGTQCPSNSTSITTLLNAGLKCYGSTWNVSTFY